MNFQNSEVIIMFRIMLCCRFICHFKFSTASFHAYSFSIRSCFLITNRFFLDLCWNGVSCLAKRFYFLLLRIVISRQCFTIQTMGKNTKDIWSFFWLDGRLFFESRELIRTHCRPSILQYISQKRVRYILK